VSLDDSTIHRVVKWASLVLWVVATWLGWVYELAFISHVTMATAFYTAWAAQDAAEAKESG
jgi:hypothetical protein